MKIFAIDTSSITCSVALCQDQKIISKGFINNGLTHSETLMPLVDRVLNGHKIEEIDLFAITSGPGSFTGLRIGMSAVKGMAAVKNTPCVEISTLEALAMGVPGDGIIYSVMDARRNQVYNAVFRKIDNTVQRICDDRAVSIDFIRDEIKNLKEKMFFVGDGTDLCYNYLKSEFDFVSALSGENKFLHAESVAALGYLNKDKAITAAKLIPHYLRLPQAERELKAKANR